MKEEIAKDLAYEAWGRKTAINLAYADDCLSIEDPGFCEDYNRRHREQEQMKADMRRAIAIDNCVMSLTLLAIERTRTDSKKKTD